MTCPQMLDISPSRKRDALLWSTAAIVMFFAHVASATWIVSQRPVEHFEDSPPPAIMIEMAAMPEAVNTEEQQISEDQVDAPEVAAAEPAQESEPEPEPQPEPEPVEELTQTIPEPEPVEPVEEPQEVAKLVEQAEVPLPVMRPPPEKVEVREEKPKPEPKPKKVEVRKEKPRERKPEVVKKRETPAEQSAPSRAAMVASAQVDKGLRNAAAQSAGSGFSGVSPARWQSKLQSHLERRKKRLARSDGQSGVVTVRFSIDTGGNVLSASVARSSGNPSLDSAVVAMVRAASPVPAPPPNAGRTVTVPIKFDR